MPVSYEVDATVASSSDAVEVEAVGAQCGESEVFIDCACVDCGRGREACTCSVGEECWQGRVRSRWVRGAGSGWRGR